MSSKHSPGLMSIPRLTTLAASLLVSLSSGTNYAYSAYAPQLGARLQITHTQLNIIGAAGNFGVYTTGPIWGRSVDTKGPRMSLASAFVLLLLGYSGIRYIFNAGLPNSSDSISTFTLCLLAMCGYMTGAGGNGGLTASVNSTAKTFPDKARATATGIVISGFGLSAFLFSTLSRLFFAGNTSSFLFLLSVGTAIPMIIGFFLVRPIRLPSTDQGHAMERGMEAEDHSLLSEEELDREIEATPSTPLSRRAALSQGRLPNVYGSKLFRSTDFWLIFSILSLLAGTGLMFINNIGSMAQALYVKDSPIYDPVKSAHWQAAQVSTISLMSFSGRIFIGLLSDFLKNSFSLPRSYSLTLVASLFLASQVIAANINTIDNLWIASAMLGLPYGMAFALFPMVCLEWFGMEHFSENWGYLCASPIIASSVFALAFGRNLDAHEGQSKGSMRPVGSPSSSPSTPVPGHGPATQCMQGRECYVAALYLTVGACFVAVLLSIWAAVRDRRKIRDGVEARSAGRGEVGWEGGYTEE